MFNIKYHNNVSLSTFRLKYHSGIHDINISYYAKIRINKNEKWRPPSLSELTPIFNMGLTHFGSEASKYILSNNDKNSCHAIHLQRKLLRCNNFMINSLFFIFNLKFNLFLIND